MNHLKVASLSMLLTACITPGPEHTPPDMAALLDQVELVQPFASQDEVLSAWWTEYGDEGLNALIAAALEQNRDLISAAANLRSARANLQLAELSRLPNDQLSTSATLSRQSAAGAPFPGAGEDIESYSVGYAPSWDLDLFGAISREIEIADASLSAQTERLRSLQLIIVADVATNYFALQSLYKEREIASQNLDLQNESLRIAQARFDNGRVSEADVLNARAQRDATASTLPLLETQIAQTTARLDVLTGRAPGGLKEQLANPSEATFIDTPLPIGSLEALVRRQPSIRASERDLAASVSEIGLNVSNLFPRLTLIGSIGLSAQDVSDLSGDDALEFSVGPSLTWSPLNLVRGRQRIAAAEARADAAFAGYEQSVLLALEDLQSALALQAGARQRRAPLVSSAQASAEAARIARAQYEFGAIAFISVLDAEARLLERELELARNEYDIINAQIAVFRALGAG
ncbi:MAG: TolC family protein [Pseudomonadota bacterium]